MEQHIISRDQFEAQLARAAAQVKDPEVGLFGPDSMMWRLSRHALFGAHGAGRANGGCDTATKAEGAKERGGEETVKDHGLPLDLLILQTKP